MKKLEFFHLDLTHLEYQIFQKGVLQKELIKLDKITPSF